MIVTMIGEPCIICQTATQSAPTPSSGEAEYVGNVRGASVGIGMQSVSRAFGDERTVRIATDSSAFASRLGLGKIRRHRLAVVTTPSATQSTELVKTLGRKNPADIGTKDLADRACARTSCTFWISLHPFRVKKTGPASRKMRSTLLHLC